MSYRKEGDTDGCGCGCLLLFLMIVLPASIILWDVALKGK